MAIAIAAAVWFGFSLVLVSGPSNRSLLALAVLLWAGIALGMAYTLPRLPERIAADDRLGRRFVKRMQLAGYWLGCAVLVGLAGFAAMLTYRALSLGFGQ